MALAESDTPIIPHLVLILGIGLSVMCGAHDELMKVIVLPAHDDLEHPMQAKKRHLALDDQASPDWWFYLGPEPGETYNSYPRFTQ